MSGFKAKIGYISALELAEGIYMGGLLVMDQDRTPLEFRYSEPLKPSRLQRVIYGRALGSYLIVDVIVKSLLSGIKTKPDLYITTSRLILELFKVLDAPLISIQESGDSLFPHMKDISRLENDGVLMQIQSLESDAQITFAGAQKDFEILEPIIKSTKNEADLIKPFKKINETLKEILKSSKIK